jgi:hypothetical protein
MSPIVWLVVAFAAAAAAYVIGLPAWRSYRARETRDLNAERYQAWRGRAVRRPSGSAREGMTGEERRRIYAGAALAVLSLAALVAFFATS